MEFGGRVTCREVDDEVLGERETADILDREIPRVRKPNLICPEGGHQEESHLRLQQLVDHPGNEGNWGKQISQVEVPRATEGVKFFRGRRRAPREESRKLTRRWSREEVDLWSSPAVAHPLKYRREEVKVWKVLETGCKVCVEILF